MFYLKMILLTTNYYCQHSRLLSLSVIHIHVVQQHLDTLQFSCMLKITNQMIIKLHEYYCMSAKI